MYEESPTGALATTSEAESPERPMWRRALPFVAAAVGPWIWFVVREWFAVFDFVAILLPLLIAAGWLVATYVAITRRKLVAAIAAVSLTLFFAASVISPWRPIDRPAPTDSVTLASLNVGAYWFSDNDAGYFAFQRQPDVLIGTELSESHDAEFLSRFDFTISDVISLRQQQENDAGALPQGEGYRKFGFPSLGIYSNYPLEQLDDPIADTVDGGLPGFRVRVDAPAGPFVLYALHIPRPGTGNGVYEVTAGEQRRMVDEIRTAVDAEDLPVVVMGDLNSVDRGSNYRTLRESLIDGMRSDNWAVPTSDRGLPYSAMLLRIDHLLISESLCATNAGADDTRFSDHRPIYADIGPCPAP